MGAKVPPVTYATPIIISRKTRDGSPNSNHDEMNVRDKIFIYYST